MKMKDNPWIVVLSAALLFFYAFLEINILNPIGSELMRDLHISAAQLGNLSSLIFYSNFIFLLPAGLMLDRFSTKKLIIAAMLFCIIGMFGFAFSHTMFFAGLSRFIAGIGGAFCFISCVRLASRWFAPTKMAFVLGCIYTMSMIGGMVAQTPMEILTARYGWRMAMSLYGILGIFCLLVIILIVKDSPEKIVKTTKTKNEDFLQTLKAVLKNRYNWLGGVYTGLMNLPIFLLGALWGMLYLVQADGFSRTSAANLISIMFIGTILGSPFFGWFADKINRRILPMIISAAFGFFTILAIIFFPHLPKKYLFILFILLGFFAGSQSLSYAVVAELNPKKNTATASSIVSMLLMAGGFLFQPLFGYLLTLGWNHVQMNGIAIYSYHDFSRALLIMPAGFLLSIFAAVLLKEGRNKKLEE